jgi:hypothetical protein
MPTTQDLEGRPPAGRGSLRSQGTPADSPGDPPLAGYEALGAREVMRAILDLPVEALLKLHGWEERHRRRAHVLGAIRRAIERKRTQR